MKISTPNLAKLFHALNIDSIPLAISKLEGVQYSSIDKNKLSFKKYITPQDITTPSRKNDPYFYIRLPDPLYYQAKKYLPELFFPTDFKITLDNVEELLNKLASLNETKFSRNIRQRHLIFARDIVKRGQTHPPFILYAASNEPLSYKHIQTLKKEFPNHHTFSIELAYAENDVLIYSAAPATSFAMLKDLLTTLNYLNLPYQVIEDPSELAASFIAAPPRLTIITYAQETLKTNWLYATLKHHDALAKIMELNAISQEFSSNIPQKINSLYHADYSNPRSGTYLEKLDLDHKQERTLKTQLSTLNHAYHPTKHVKIEYAIQKLANRYDVSPLHFLRKNLPTIKCPF